MLAQSRLHTKRAFPVGLALSLCLIWGFAAWGAPQNHVARHAGTQWFDGSLDQALARAKQKRQKVLIKFEASWCGPCRRLAQQVFDTPAGRSATEKLVALRVDFDDPANRALIERYVVLGLPTTVIVDETGEQLSRIMGYDGRARYLSLLAQEAVDPLPKLEALYQKSPSDDARLALAKALLVRSGASSKRRNRALKLLEPLLWRAANEGPEERRRRERLGEALFVLGRFHHRVRRDPTTAQHLWRALAQRCADTSWAGGAWWWFAKSQAELGRPQSGAFALAEQHRRARKPMSTIRQWIRFAEKHHLRDEAQALQDALTTLATSAQPSKKKLDHLKRRVWALGHSAAAAP